ncbi:YvcK family protein [Anaerolineales bacterium HSG25]|nr:YvcK family protein [Anaerolineales bacterium HSG25]
MINNFKSTFRWWLHPGLGLKRWLLPLLIGIIILGLGVGLFLRDLYGAAVYPPLLRLLLLQMLPRWIRAMIFCAIGVALTGYSIYQLNKTVLAAFLPDQASASYVAERVYRHRQRRRGGPKLVVIGGGTGLSVLLSGLKHHTENITAIVTVADDGGSSGKLRRELGVLPPGDFRNCIAALADDEALTTQLFQYRFRSGQGLEGHSFGNLFITVMASIAGSFENALYESGRVLNIRGRILPSTLENVTLFAELIEGSQTRKVQGESAIPEAKLPIDRVYFEPDEPLAFPPALQAILNADVIIAGPGSLYTSVIPNLLVREISTAIEASDATKIYICNVATQPGETDHYSVDDHVQVIERHTSFEGYYHKKSLFEFVLVNNNQKQAIPADMNLQAILPEQPDQAQYKLIKVDVVDEQSPWRHDPIKLANQLMRWYKNYKPSV